MHPADFLTGSRRGVYLAAMNKNLPSVLIALVRPVVVIVDVVVIGVRRIAP